MKLEKDCPFCKIDLDKTRVLEDHQVYFVALSNPRLIEGHLLVVPKRHVEKPWELTSEEISTVYNTILKYQKRIIEKFTCGCDIRQNYRPFLPQGRVKVDHVHFHLLPRELEDEYFKTVQISEKELWVDLSEEEIAKMKGLLDDKN